MRLPAPTPLKNEIATRFRSIQDLPSKHIVFGSSAPISPSAPLVLGEIHRIGFDRRTEI
jgi:hypothetical protein